MEPGIAVFGLTGNPPHCGHRLILGQIAALPWITDVFVTVSFKPTYKKCAAFRHRLNMCMETFSDLPKVQVVNWTFNYTWTLIHFMKKQYKSKIYFFVGADWLIDEFKNSEYIRANCTILHFPSHGYDCEGQLKGFATLPISSTMIRQKVQDDLPIAGYVIPSVQHYIYGGKLYDPNTKERKGLSKAKCNG